MAGEAGFRGLKVWQKGMDVSDVVYAATRSFPKEELFGLTSQLRRAACSVPMNIAGGYRRKKRKADYLKFLRYADGSSAGLETAIEISERQGYIKPDNSAAMIVQYQEIGRMLGGLISRIEREMED